MKDNINNLLKIGRKKNPVKILFTVAKSRIISLLFIIILFIRDCTVVSTFVKKLLLQKPPCVVCLL